MTKKRDRLAKLDSEIADRRSSLLMMDREQPGAEAAFSRWCIARALSFPCPLSRVEKGCRFVLVGKAGRRPPFTLGSNDLDDLVRRAWSGLRGRALGEAGAFDTILADPERSQLAAWLAQTDIPVITPPTAGECPRGFVSVLASADSPRFLESSLPKMMLRVADELLAASGIEAPKRPHAAAGLRSLAGVSHRERVGDAIIENAPTAVFAEGDDGLGTTILTGDYVLPVDGGMCSMHVVAALAVHKGLRTQEQGEFSVRNFSFGWVGLDAAAAEIRTSAVLASLQADGFVSGWEAPATALSGVPETVFELAWQAMCRRDADLARLEKVNGAAAAELEAERAATRRAEQRGRDREADLILQRDAARATVERERARAKQELCASQAETQSIESINAHLFADAERRADGLESRCAELQAVADDRVEELDALRQALHAVEAERDAAIMALTSMGAPPASAPVLPSTTTLAELGGWSHRALGGKVVVVPRALRSARKSNFGDPALVYRVLEALRDDYWAMKFDPSGNAKVRWQQFLRRERLTCGPTGMGPESRLAETYHASWDGRRVPLDMHLQGHSGRDEVRQFRLYFHNDEVAKQIVIGHLPSHLPNRDT